AAMRSPGEASLIGPVALLRSLQTWTSAPESKMKLWRRGNSSSLEVVNADKAKLWCCISFFSSELAVSLASCLLFCNARSTASFFPGFLSCSSTFFRVAEFSFQSAGAAELSRYQHSVYQ